MKEDRARRRIEVKALADKLYEQYALTTRLQGELQDLHSQLAVHQETSRQADQALKEALSYAKCELVATKDQAERAGILAASQVRTSNP